MPSQYKTLSVYGRSLAFTVLTLLLFSFIGKTLVYFIERDAVTRVNHYSSFQSQGSNYTTCLCESDFDERLSFGIHLYRFRSMGPWSKGH